jgi:hypothetical protein
MSEVETRGLPTVLVATCEFVSGEEAQDKALGCDLNAVYTEHPIQDRTDDEMLEIADAAFEGLIAGAVGILNVSHDYTRSVDGRSVDLSIDKLWRPGYRERSLLCVDRLPIGYVGPTATSSTLPASS